VRSLTHALSLAQQQIQKQWQRRRRQRQQQKDERNANAREEAGGKIRCAAIVPIPQLCVRSSKQTISLGPPNFHSDGARGSEGLQLPRRRTLPAFSRDLGARSGVRLPREAPFPPPPKKGAFWGGAGRTSSPWET